MDVKLAAQLKDIHLPPEPSFWPPAIGWWLVLLLFILTIIGVFFIWAKHKRGAPRREAQQLLDEIEKNYLSDNDTVVYVSEINKLIRRVAMQAFSRQQCAGKSGEKWLEFLQQHSKVDGFTHGVGRCLIEVPFSNKEIQIDHSELKELAGHWIKENL